MKRKAAALVAGASQDNLRAVCSRGESTNVVLRSLLLRQRVWCASMRSKSSECYGSVIVRVMHARPT